LSLAKENNVQAITSVKRDPVGEQRDSHDEGEPVLSERTFQAGQSKSAGDRLGQSGQLVPYTSVWSTTQGLNANLTLFDGGRTFADLRARKADVVTQEAAQVSNQATIAFNVKQAYNSVLSANEAEAAARAQLALAVQNLAVTVARVNAGAANIADSLNSVVTVGTRSWRFSARSRACAPRAPSSRATSPLHIWSRPIPADTPTLAHITVDSASIMQLALDGPSVRQLESQLTANEASRRSAKSAYLPSVTAGVGFQGSRSQ